MIRRWSEKFFAPGILFSAVKTSRAEVWQMMDEVAGARKRLEEAVRNVTRVKEAQGR
jgi:hypothetical protein